MRRVTLRKRDSRALWLLEDSDEIAKYNVESDGTKRLGLWFSYPRNQAGEP